MTTRDQLPSEEKSCKCADGTWILPRNAVIPPICERFKRDDYDMCEHCNHDEACHENRRVLLFRFAD